MADRWPHSAALPPVRLFGGALLMLAGVWIWVAGPLFDQKWLDIVGPAMVALGGYLLLLGLKGMHHGGSRTASERL